jgi:hypothetical protein
LRIGAQGSAVSGNPGGPPFNATNRPPATAIRLIGGAAAQIVTKEATMKRMRFVFTLLTAGILALVVCQGALADSGKPIAGVLDSDTPYGEFTFKSAGNQILFAEIKSEIYQTIGRKGGSHETGEETDGGCTDSSHTDDTHDEGCGGSGGAGDFCLQVWNPVENKKLCWAGRPERPGWQRDPRLACPIPYSPEDGEFTLRVFPGQCGNPDMTLVSIEPGASIAYLLEVKLLNIAQDGSLKDAMAQGKGEDK